MRKNGNKGPSFNIFLIISPTISPISSLIIDLVQLLTIPPRPSSLLRDHKMITTNPHPI